MYCAYTRPRFQVSVYKTIGPLLFFVFFVCVLGGGGCACVLGCFSNVTQSITVLVCTPYFLT